MIVKKKKGTMRISLLQSDVAWADVEENIRRADRLIDAHAGAELYVLPEMFSTGFATDPQGIAEPAEGPALSWMKQKAAATGAAMAGSVATAADGRFFNRFYFVKPSGEVVSYDKRHLFSYAGEHERYSRGEERVVVEWLGVRILLQVCYDLRFPVFSRNRGDYDLVLYVASWPQSRRRVWDVLLRARALENQCYVAGVNRVGDDPQCHYDGGTVLINAYGRDLATCQDEEACVCSGEIDIEALRAFRKKFPVLQDADQV